MSALLGLLAVIYGASMAVGAGGWLLLSISPEFKRQLIGETPKQ